MQQKLSKTPAKNPQTPSKNSAKPQQKTRKHPAKTQQNARCLDVFTHARARQSTVQKIGRGGNEGGEGKEEKEEEAEEEKEEDEEEDEEEDKEDEEDEEDEKDEKDEEEEEDEAKRRGEGRGGGGGEGSLSKISSEETLSKLRLKLNQNKAKSTKHAGRPADLFFRERIGESFFFTIRLAICLPPCRNHSHLHMFVSSSLAKTIVSCVTNQLLCQNKSFPAAADWRLILAYFGESMAKVQPMHG